MIRQEIIKLLKRAVEDSGFKVEVVVEHPENAEFGDYATAVALQIAKAAGMRPERAAEIITSKLKVYGPELFEKIEIVKPGFINFFIFKEYLQEQVGEILKRKEKFGQLKMGEGKKVNVEFISANPTGPLTLGNGRGGFCGDVLANILSESGHKVEREYYVNDVGEQVRKLGHSVLGDLEAVYKGPYIEELRKRIKGDKAEEVGKKAAEIILKEMIKPFIVKMGVRFDNWFYESGLYKKREIDKILKELEKKNLIYKKDNALWFQSTKFGDDKDRVLIKADGEKTYFASDIAYLKNKINRGFDEIIIFLGADHYGYIGRMKAAAQALGFDKEKLHIIIMQLVAVWFGEKENKTLLRMSKREGIYLGIDELIKQLGIDIVRFFFLTKSPDSHLNFDMDLAREQSEKNPVYCVQYAHARICSILSKFGKSEIRWTRSGLPGGLHPKSEKLKLLNHPSELELIKQLMILPEIIEDTAKDYQVQRLPQYAMDLAAAFHRFYRDCRVISEDKNLTQARLSLVLATRIVLRNILSLMGVSAPEKM